MNHPPDHSPSCPLPCWFTRWAAWGLGLQLSGAALLAGSASTNCLHVGFTAQMIGEVNDYDALAALKVWTVALADACDISAVASPTILGGTDAAAQALRQQTIDALALSTPEYWELREELDPQVFVAGSSQGAITEEYLLLVSRTAGIHQLADLRGRRLLQLRNARMSLALVWLDTVLLEAGFPATTNYCRVTAVSKLSRAVLPVFFGRQDACLVTRRGFAVMCELNPQVHQRLEILLSSPAVVPGGFCFRRTYEAPLRDRVLAALDDIVATPAGRQVMVLFQTETLEAHPVSCLDGAFGLLEKHRRLLRRTAENAIAAPFPVTSTPTTTDG